MTQDRPLDRSQIAISALTDQGRDLPWSSLTPAERLAMVWPLTLEAWAFKDPSIVERRFQRHVVRVKRGRG